MLGRNHAAMGLLIGEAVLLVGHTHSLAIAPTLIGLTAGSLWPDVDEPNSRVSRSLGFISRTFSSVVNLVSGGHRQATHSPIGIAIMGACAYLIGLSHVGHLVLAIGATFIILKSVVPWGIRALLLGGTIGAAVISVFVGFWLSHAALLPLVIGFGLGSLIHLAGDWVTPSGVPWLWPISSRHFSLGLWSTDSFTEHLVGLVLWIGVFVGGWHLLGTVALPSLPSLSSLPSSKTVRSSVAGHGFSSLFHYAVTHTTQLFASTIVKLQSMLATFLQQHHILGKYL